MSTTGTGVVSLTSDLVRKRWIREGMVQAASKSFWAPYTGTSFDSIVFQANNENADSGHTVVFDFDGNLAARAYKDKETAFGKGATKKKFSDKITVSRFRWPVDNGDSFDGVNIGDLSVTQHADSRIKLMDNWVLIKDQILFDTAQGFKGSAGISHIIKQDASSTKIAYGDFAAIEKILKTGYGYYSEDTAATPGTYTAITTKRSPLKPFRTQNGDPVWLVVIDPITAHNIKSNSTANSGIMAMAQQADLRGNNNRVFKGVIGQVGALVIVEATSFFGLSVGNGTGIEDQEVEIAGLREYDATNGAWSGTSSYSASAADKWSRNLILGAGGLQIAFGKQPDYHFQLSPDFGITSESALEVWFETQKTNLTAENTDYSEAKIASLDFGVVAWDVMTST